MHRIDYSQVLTDIRLRRLQQDARTRLRAFRRAAAPRQGRGEVVEARRHLRMLRAEHFLADCQRAPAPGDLARSDPYNRWREDAMLAHHRKFVAYFRVSTDKQGRLWPGQI